MMIDWLLALSPIVVILVLMIRYRWSAAKAGSAGWLTAMIVAGVRFGAGIELLAISHAKAFFLSLDVLLIIWAAFLLYRVAHEAGAIDTIGELLPRLTADRGMQALLIGWAFASFLQGVGGFGVPVAVTAPLLIGLGFSPLASIVIPSIGHAWSVTFGSLASSFQALIAASGLPGEALASPAATLLGLAGVGAGAMVAHAAGGMSAVRRLAWPTIVLALGMGLTQYTLAVSGFWNIAGFGGGIVGVILGSLLARRYRGERVTRSGAEMRPRSVLIAASGYVALVVLTAMVQLIPSVRSALGTVVLGMSFPELQTSLGFVTPAGSGRQIHLFRHAGAILGYAALVAYLVYRKAGLYPTHAGRLILGGTLRRVLPSSLGIVSMVSMAVVMTHAGMTDRLAEGLAHAVGALFPLVSSWIGALGAFMTGSNTNSNVVFAALQRRTAELLGLSVPLMLAAQTAGGAIGSVLAPTKIVVGASTAGMAGREGEVLRALLGYIAVLILGVSVLVWLVAQIWSA